MYAYELLPKLKYLTLVGQDDEGNLEWIGTKIYWELAEKMQQEMEERVYE